MIGRAPGWKQVSCESDTLTFLAFHFLVGRRVQLFMVVTHLVVQKGFSGRWSFRYRKMVVSNVLGSKTPLRVASASIHRWLPSLPPSAVLVFILPGPCYACSCPRVFALMILPACSTWPWTCSYIFDSYLGFGLPPAGVLLDNGVESSPPHPSLHPHYSMASRLYFPCHSFL